MVQGKVQIDESEALAADLDATSSGNTQLVAAVTDRRIRVTSVLATNGGGSTISINFQSSTTEITATHMLAANGGGYARDMRPDGYLFQTAVGEALNLNLDANGTVGCDVSYKEVP
jgi:hypothetical protein